EDQPRLNPTPTEAVRRPDAAPAHWAGSASAQRTVEAAWRIEGARIVAAVTHYDGDFPLAEDFAQEAFADALSTWPESGIPRIPAAWLTRAAKRKAIDHWRRRERLDDRIADLGRGLIAAAEGVGTAPATSPVGSSRLGPRPTATPDPNSACADLPRETDPVERRR